MNTVQSSLLVSSQLEAFLPSVVVGVPMQPEPRTQNLEPELFLRHRRSSVGHEGRFDSSGLVGLIQDLSEDLIQGVYGTLYLHYCEAYSPETRM